MTAFFFFNCNYLQSNYLWRNIALLFHCIKPTLFFLFRSSPRLDLDCKEHIVKVREKCVITKKLLKFLLKARKKKKKKKERLRISYSYGFFLTEEFLWMKLVALK